MKSREDEEAAKEEAKEEEGWEIISNKKDLKTIDDRRRSRSALCWRGNPR